MVAQEKALLVSNRGKTKQGTRPKKVNSQPNEGGCAKATALVGKNGVLIHGMETSRMTIPITLGSPDFPEFFDSVEVIPNPNGLVLAPCLKQ